MKKILLATAAVLGLAAPGIAHATLTYQVWTGAGLTSGGLPLSSGLNPIPPAVPNLPAGAPNFNFTSTQDNLNFSTVGQTNTFGNFFDGGLVPITSGTPPGTGIIMSTADNSLTSFIHITEFYTGQAGAIPGGLTHDDGAEIFVTPPGGPTAFVCGTPGPNSPENQACNLPAGAAGAGSRLDLYYIESHGGPAVLQVNLPTEVTPAAAPEPASLALLGSALVGFGVWYRRRRTS